MKINVVTDVVPVECIIFGDNRKYITVEVHDDFGVPHTSYNHLWFWTVHNIGNPGNIYIVVIVEEIILFHILILNIKEQLHTNLVIHFAWAMYILQILMDNNFLIMKKFLMGYLVLVEVLCTQTAQHMLMMSKWF